MNAKERTKQHFNETQNIITIQKMENLSNPCMKIWLKKFQNQKAERF